MQENTLFPDQKSSGTCLVHYTIQPPITAEGDEDEAEIFGYIIEAFNAARATYVGFTFPETPDRLQDVEGDLTNIYFTVELESVTPFNSEQDFTPGIVKALESGEAEINLGQYFDDSVALKMFDIGLTKII